MYSPQEITEMSKAEIKFYKEEEQKKSAKISSDAVKDWLAGQNDNLSGKDLFPKKK